MGDTSSAVPSCRECGGELPTPAKTGRRHIYCPPCRESRQRASRQAHKARHRAGVQPPTHYTCQDCNNDFPRPHLGTMPIRCPACRLAHQRARGNAKWKVEMAKLRLKFETEGRWATCQDCGAAIRCIRQKGAAPVRCEPCRVTWHNARMKRARPWIRAGSCQECGGPTDRASRPVPRDVCPTCSKKLRDPKTGSFIPKQQRHEGFPASWTKIRGPWHDRFTRLEIFERDQWTCAICKKKIDKRLRHPNRWAATIDHIIPVIEGGLDLRANVRAAHQSCNSSRNHRGGGEQLALIG